MLKSSSDIIVVRCGKRISTYWARFTKQGKLARERNLIKAQMGVESSA